MTFLEKIRYTLGILDIGDKANTDAFLALTPREQRQMLQRADSKAIKAILWMETNGNDNDKLMAVMFTLALYSPGSSLHDKNSLDGAYSSFERIAKIQQRKIYIRYPLSDNGMLAALNMAIMAFKAKIENPEKDFHLGLFWGILRKKRVDEYKKEKSTWDELDEYNSKIEDVINEEIEKQGLVNSLKSYIEKYASLKCKAIFDALFNIEPRLLPNNKRAMISISEIRSYIEKNHTGIDLPQTADALSSAKNDCLEKASLFFKKKIKIQSNEKYSKRRTTK